MVQEVVAGMQEYSWGRSLAIVTMKSIIAHGRCNATRKRNKELAAAGTPAPRGRPRSTMVPQANVLLAQKRAMPQAMSGEEIERWFGKRPKHRPCSTAVSEPGDDAAAAAEMVLKFHNCHPR